MSEQVERVAKAVHAARFSPGPPDPYPYEDEDAGGQEYCRRIARAAIAAMNDQDGQGTGALSGSRASTEPASRLHPSGFDPERPEGQEPVRRPNPSHDQDDLREALTKVREELLGHPTIANVLTALNIIDAALKGDA